MKQTRSIGPSPNAASEEQLTFTEGLSQRSLGADRFAAKAHDLEALRDAVLDAASVGTGLWFSYLFVLLYLAIAVGSVTHRDLLYSEPDV